jgi:hypothetical protein
VVEKVEFSNMAECGEHLEESVSVKYYLLNMFLKARKVMLTHPHCDPGSRHKVGSLVGPLSGERVRQP